jgi:hypothetical protein
MGMWPFKCTLGFSTSYTNESSERLERRATELDYHFRKAHAALLNGMSSLHDAVDTASAKDGAQMVASYGRGLAELRRVQGGGCENGRQSSAYSDRLN